MKPGAACPEPGAGHAYRLTGAQIKEEFPRNGEIQLRLLRYTQALLTQMAQTAVCKRYHSLDQQPCHWLLPTSNSVYAQ
jgi:hypothetical protein